jgi:integrase
MVGRYHIDPETAVLKVQDWPKADQTLWLASFSRDDPFAETGQMSGLREISNTKVAKGYGRFLTFVIRHDSEALNFPPGDRITPERTKAFVDNMRLAGNGDRTLLARLQELHSAACVMAPKGYFDFIRRLEARIRANAKPVRKKQERFVTSDELLDLGLKLLADADQQSTPRLKAIDYRDGLMIALLALRPLRRKNFAEITLDHHLVKRNGSWILKFERDETKTHDRIERAWPEILVDHLEHYIGVHRPILMAIKGRWQKPINGELWVSSNSSPLTEMAVYQQVTNRTEEAFGRSINPHLFRDAAASTMALEDPTHVRVGASVLAHRSFQTTEQHYIQAQMTQAHESFTAFMVQKRKQSKQTLSGRGAG